MDDLKGLLDCLNSGEGVPYALFAKAFDDLIPDRPSEHFHPILRDKAREAFLGSLDAAKCLHDATLPGWEYGYDGSIAWVKRPGLRTSYRHDSQNGHTSKAWLVSIIKALIASPNTERE